MNSPARIRNFLRKEKRRNKNMKTKKILAFVMTLVLVLGFNVTSVFAAEGVWTIDGLPNTEYTTDDASSTNNVSWTNSSSSDYGYSYSIWSGYSYDGGATFYQTVTLTAGDYTFSVNYQGGDTNVSYFYGFVGDSEGEQITPTTWYNDTDATAWDLYEVTFTVDDDGSYDVGVYVDTTIAGCYACFDNFSLTDSSGTEYLVMGSLDFDDSEWSTYIVSNVDDSSDDSGSDDDTNETTASSDDDDDDSSSSSTPAASTGDSTPIVMAAIALIAAAAFVVARKKKASE